jgi:PIN domain nuclease of toxin-antitoxin system
VAVNDTVLDASALLALLNAERGADQVQGHLAHALISSVNLAEVVTRLTLLKMPEGELREAIAVLGLEIAPFDEEQAYQAGLLSILSEPLGLSLGDRACLALALTTSSTALTADRAWQDLNIGVDIKLIR